MSWTAWLFGKGDKLRSRLAASSLVAGVGSPHTPYDHIWPMSVIIEALTASPESAHEKRLRLMKMLDETTGVDSRKAFVSLHESFHKRMPSIYTRDRFCWVNSLYSELFIEVSRKYNYTSLVNIEKQ